MSSYSSSIVTMGLSCAVFEIKREKDRHGRKTPIFILPVFYLDGHDSLELLGIFTPNFNTNCPCP